ncbi:hypothetical protein [Paraburkholderia sp.]|uniref:hypothetical protein n=1 Tax=Paraburkholderia sp. TaxID=1926495 RepID=UPI002F407909
MTSRMLTIAATCALLLGVLLFLLGIEIGTRFAASPDTSPTAAAPATVSTGTVAPQSSPDAGSVSPTPASPPAPASSTL